MFSPYVSQVIRLYTGTNHVEMEFTVGPILTKYDLLLKLVTVEPPLSGPLLSRHLHCLDSPNWSCDL